MLHKLLGGLSTRFQSHKSNDCLAFEIVRATNHCCFGDSWMAHQGGFNLHGAETVTGDVDHVINPTHHPEVPVGITAGTIPREVEVRPISRANVLPVALTEPLRVSVHRAHHPRPGGANSQVATLIGIAAVAFRIDDVRLNPRQRQGC